MAFAAVGDRKLNELCADKQIVGGIKKRKIKNSPGQLISGSSPAELQGSLQHASVCSWKLIHEQTLGLLQTAVMTWVVHTGAAPGPVITASWNPHTLPHHTLTLPPVTTAVCHLAWTGLAQHSGTLALPSIHPRHRPKQLAGTAENLAWAACMCSCVPVTAQFFNDLWLGL